MISPRKIKNYTKLAMMKSTQAQKNLNEIENDALVNINHQFESISLAIGQLSDVSNQLMQDTLNNGNAIGSIENTIQSIQNALSGLNTEITNLKQRVDALETI